MYISSGRAPSRFVFEKGDVLLLHFMVCMSSTIDTTIKKGMQSESEKIFHDALDQSTTEVVLVFMKMRQAELYYAELKISHGMADPLIAAASMHEFGCTPDDHSGVKIRELYEVMAPTSGGEELLKEELK